MAGELLEGLVEEGRHERGDSRIMTGNSPKRHNDEDCGPEIRSSIAGGPTAIDFSRSGIHYVPRNAPIWVRIRIDCRCRIIQRETGHADEYVMSVRTQTGLRSDPPSDVEDPGYDFWMIFSKRKVFIRRSHASAYVNCPSRLDADEFLESGWHLHRRAATPLRNGAAIREALRSWRAVTARSEFDSEDGSTTCAIDYPVKWADGNDDDTWRVETGPVVLLDPNRIRPGCDPNSDDFQWAYLDLRGFDRARIFLERPTSLLSGARYADATCRHPALDEEQVRRIEERLFSGWEPPIPAHALRRLFETDHYSAVTMRPARTELFALEDVP